MPYVELASAKGLPLFTVMLTDYLKAPLVDAIDRSGYHGQVGDIIRIRASAYAGVTAVNVAIRAPDLTVREQGRSCSLGRGCTLPLRYGPRTNR